MDIERRDKEGEAERLLAERLTEGGPDRTDPEAEAVRKLPPRWEIRIQSERDPVAEETKLYRSMAKEVDDRYDGREGK
ncbi:hypothetical protein GE107_06220 [Cohnella sp. CFH 77786]|uniref:hypothetical protein n=1 Tax=Cohnella sp. CFH 77786 TaxID=2662265 RepID=UPI001C608B11|nr:hypothetical protein [Cohnella sp. CFH 77786]MBW5445659.1 hypothetical protein [Cohnella sp. CFH 77786]